MGLMQRLGLKPTWQAPPPEILAAPIIDSLLAGIDALPVDQLWKEQPHLRTVTTFIARSIASVSLHVYARSADGGRERVRDGELSQVVRKANRSQTMYDVLYRAVMDLCLHDEFWWYIGGPTGEREVLPIPPEWIVSRTWSDPWTLATITINDDKTGAPVVIPAEDLIWVHGYAPATMKHGMTPVVALRDTLREQLEAASYRAQLWRNGPRLGGVITRPKDAGEWTGVARRRFKAEWRSAYSGRGSGAGGSGHGGNVVNADGQGGSPGKWTSKSMDGVAGQSVTVTVGKPAGGDQAGGATTVSTPCVGTAGTNTLTAAGGAAGPGYGNANGTGAGTSTAFGVTFTGGGGGGMYNPGAAPGGGGDGWWGGYVAGASGGRGQVWYRFRAY